MEVEIIKLGSILEILPMPGTRVYDTSQFGKKTIQVVTEAGSTYDWYLDILKKNLRERYNFLENKIEEPLVRFSNVVAGRILTGYSRKGQFHTPPQLGKPFELDLGGWITSTVLEIIDEDIIITKNSIYAIHHPQKMRDKKIEDLGI
jgi:hypothetical protein